MCVLHRCIYLCVSYPCIELPTISQTTSLLAVGDKKAQRQCEFTFLREEVCACVVVIGCGYEYTFTTPGHMHPIALTAPYFFRKEKDRWMDRRGRSPTMPHPTLSTPSYSLYYSPASICVRTDTRR